MSLVKTEEYKAIYDGERFLHYQKANGDLVGFSVERDEDEPSESGLYRVRICKDGRNTEKLINNEWIPAPLYHSLQFDGLLEEITVEEAEKIAEQIGEVLVD